MVPGRKSAHHSEPEPEVELAHPATADSSSRPDTSPTSATAVGENNPASTTVKSSSSPLPIDGADVLRDLRSLWLVPTFLVALIAALLFLAGRFHSVRVHWQPLILFAVVGFVVIYFLVDRRSRALICILETHQTRLQVANERLVSLNQMGRSVAADLDLEHVLQAICDSAKSMLRADWASVELASKLRPGALKTLNNPAWRMGSPLTLWSGEAPPAPVFGAAQPEADWACVSRVIEGATGETLGTIKVYRLSTPFDEVDEEILTAVAQQAATAITNAQHFEASRRRSSDLRDLVLRGADAVAASDDLTRVASIVARQACKIVSCEGAGIFLFGEDRRLLTPAAAVLADGRLVDGSRVASFYTRPIALGDATLLKAILSSPGAMAVEDVTAYSEGRAWAAHAGIASIIAAPIVGRVHGALGVLIVHWPDRHVRFDQEEPALVGALAAFAAVAIENAKLSAASKDTQRLLSERNEKLLEETQRRRLELQKLVHRVGDALVAGLSCDKVSQLVVDQVRQMIPCHQVVFWMREDDTLFVPLALPCGPTTATDPIMGDRWNMKSSRFLRDIVENAHPILVSDVAEDGRLGSNERMALRRREVTSLLVAPLRGRGDVVIGLLALYWTVPRHTPTPEEFEIADVLATQAAAALENARLHSELEEAERRLSIQLDQTTVARDFVEQILQNVQAAVMVIEPEPKHRIVRANVLAEVMPDPGRRGFGIVGRAFYEVLPGIDEVVGPAVALAFEAGETITLVDVAYDGFARGTTHWTFSFTPQRDPTGNVERLIMLALETTDRIRLLRENELHARRAELLVRISQSLSATLEQQEIYEVVAQGALSMVDDIAGRRAEIYVRDQRSGRLDRASTAVDDVGIDVDVTPNLQGLLGPQVIPLETDAERSDCEGAALLLPLISQSTLIGYLAVSVSNVRVFDDSGLVDALGSLASLSAAVIQNAQAFAYEQNIAETLQKSFLPSTPARMPGLEIAQRYFPTLRNEAEIGGDYYDVIVLDASRLAVFIGDISGKGLAAAVYTAMAKYTMRAFIAQEMPPLEVVSRANVAVTRWTSHEIFSTLFYAVIDVANGTIAYVNAGHEPAVLLRSTGETESLDPTGPTLGIFAAATFTVGEASFKSGDIVTLYTDGLSDSRNAHGEFFGETGIRDHMIDVRDDSVDDVCDSLYAHAVEYAAGHRLRDDVAMLVIKST